MNVTRYPTMFKALFRALVFSCCFSAAFVEAGLIDQTVHAVRKSSLRPIEGGVRILIEGKCSEIPLAIEGSYGIYSNDRKSRLSGGLLSKAFPLIAGQEGISWGESFPDTYQISIVPEGTHRGFTLKERFYPGILHVYQVGGSLRLVNELTPEEFALAIVNVQEWHATPPVEAAASLAICARTLGLAMSRERDQQFWHFEALRCGYAGYSNPESLSECSKAQAKSLGLILIRRNRRPYITEWTSDCAGHTIDYDRMHRTDAHFPRGGSVGVRSKPAELNRKQSSWRAEMSNAVLAQSFQLDEPFNIQLERDPTSNKVQMVAISDRKGKASMDFYRFQRLCAGHIASSEFSIEREKSQIIFSGFGSGPGVGLCLYSAVAMAHEGKMANEILAHFFPNSELILSSAVH